MMHKGLLFILLFFTFSCQKTKHKSANDVLKNSNGLAISYGGYRQNSRDIQPTQEEITEDLKILAAMNVKIVRTYNTKLAEASTLLKAIKDLKEQDSSFEMYVMLGVWIDCKGAWTPNPEHDKESLEANTQEIARAVAMAKEYPDIVKIIAVGNEAMVHWATGYFVEPAIILKWVNYLQGLKRKNELPEDLWITSSDNFAAWGGESADYHTNDLENLIKAVDYISLHSYPFHDTHYNPVFWKSDSSLTKVQQIDTVMKKTAEYSIAQYNAVEKYVTSLGVKKQIHIGETGWASYSDGFYGPEGSHAADEYKQALYYKYMREWSQKKGISCFYFEAFDENWKDGKNPSGSENHFGLINLDSEAKYPLWSMVDKGAFTGITRNGKPITKTFGGNKEEMMKTVLLPNITNR